MSQQAIQFMLFGQGHGEPVILTLGGGLGLAALECKIQEVLVFPSDAPMGVIAAVDEETALDEDSLTQFIKGDKPKHLYSGHCRHITVSLSFNGEVKENKVAPAVKVKRVLKWAIKAFDIPASDAPKMELRINETGKGLPPDYPIGAFVVGKDCALKVYLVNKEIHNG